MLALAVLDLPFEAPKHKTEIDGAKLSFTAAGRCIAFHREIKRGEAGGGPPAAAGEPDVTSATTTATGWRTARRSTSS